MATPKYPPYHSLEGKRLGIGARGELATRNTGATPKRLTSPIVGAVITVGNEITDARALTVQLVDANGNNVDYAAVFEIVMFASAAMLDFMSGGGSTGVAIGANGKLQAIVAKLLFRCISDATGKWTGTYTDTGTQAGFIAVRLPNGEIVPGALVTNA
jgi:hypothetical protein